MYSVRTTYNSVAAVATWKNQSEDSCWSFRSFWSLELGDGVGVRVGTGRTGQGKAGRLVHSFTSLHWFLREERVVYVWLSPLPPSVLLLLPPEGSWFAPRQAACLSAYRGKADKTRQNGAGLALTTCYVHTVRTYLK